MVRFETVEVTKEIMKNMAKKPQRLRKSNRSSTQNKRGAASPESSQSSPAGSSSPSSSSCSSDSSDVSSQPSLGGGDSPTYCVMSTIPHLEEEPAGLTQDDCDDSHMSGAVQALTEVARGLGMDVAWFSHHALHHFWSSWTVVVHLSSIDTGPVNAVEMLITKYLSMLEQIRQWFCSRKDYRFFVETGNVFGFYIYVCFYIYI